jgi:hypothetical protein
MESIEALSNLINRAEGAMVSSRKTYEAAIAARNNTGELVAEEHVDQPGSQPFLSNQINGCSSQ